MTGEATEEMVASLLRQAGFVVATDVKISSRGEKTYGGQIKDFPVDIIAINPKKKELIVGEVKSWWGSTGLTPNHIVGTWPEKPEKPSQYVNSFKILNNKDGIREKFERLVKEQFGDYDYKFVLYAGRAKNEPLIRHNLSNIKMFGKPVELVMIRELLADFINSIQTTKNKISTYNNEIAIATLQALNEYKMLKSTD